MIKVNENERVYLEKEKLFGNRPYDKKKKKKIIEIEFRIDEFFKTIFAGCLLN